MRRYAEKRTKNKNMNNVNHSFSTVVVNGVPVAGPCSKCALLRSELLDNAGVLQGCQFPEPVPAPAPGN